MPPLRAPLAAALLPPLLLLLLLPLLLLASGGARTAHANALPTPPEAFPELFAAFSFVNFTFRTAAEYQTFLSSGAVQNCMIAGIKTNSRGEVFISVPRWKSGVPATFNRLVGGIDSPVPLVNPMLDPYPSWELNAIGGPNVENALQSVLGFEVDADDRLWILDQGRVESGPALAGSIKIVIWNTLTNQLIRVVPFPSSIASLRYSFMNDIVVDMRVNQVAYITDSGLPPNDTYPNPTYPALLVYDYRLNELRRVMGQPYFGAALDLPMVDVNESVWVNINSENVLPTTPLRTGADGIALSCDMTTLYVCPLTSRDLYAIDTQYLIPRNANASNLAPHVRHVGYKLSASDGLASSDRKQLFLTAIELNGVLFNYEETFRDLVNSPRLPLATLVSDDAKMMWPDTIGFDVNSHLYFVSNQLQNFYQGRLTLTTSLASLDAAAYRIWRVSAIGHSYVFGCSTALDESIVVAIAVSLFVVVAVTIVVVIVCVRRRRLLAATGLTPSEAIVRGLLAERRAAGYADAADDDADEEADSRRPLDSPKDSQL